MNKKGVNMTLVQAGPGAGKTRDLTGRIMDLIAQGISPYSIIALTFSREAANEITHRTDGEVAAKTNHSFALNLIGLAAKARGGQIPRIIDDEQSKKLIERAAQETKRTQVDLTKVREQIAKHRELGVPLQKLDPATEVITKRYFQIMDAENMMDFTGILERTRKELQNQDLQTYLSEQYVFLDEGQDTNPYNEWPIMERLFTEALGFTMFASPSQSIYGFRGANWKRLEEKLPAGYLIEKKIHNHRSSPEIVKAFGILAGDDAKNMIPSKPSEGIPVLWVDAINPDMELDYIGRQVAKWLETGAISKPSQNAILTRLHTQLYPIQRLLSSRGIPVTLMANKHNPFQREETKALLGYLKLAADPMDDAVLEDIIDYPHCGIGSRRRYQLRKDDDLQWDHLLTALACKEDFPEQVIQRILQILDAREILDDLFISELPVSNRVARAIDLMGIQIQLMADGDYNGVKALDDLVKSSKEFNTIPEFVEYLDEELQKPRETEGVKLGTLHASKGLEWEGVILPGLQEGALPMSGGDEVEEQNLAFVGVSRPMKRLVLTSSATTPVSKYVPMIYQESIKWPRKK